MPGYEVAKYDLIWICDSGIRGKIFLFYKTVHLMVKYQKHFENTLFFYQSLVCVIIYVIIYGIMSVLVTKILTFF